MKILVCRLTWMQTYASTMEDRSSNHKHIVDGNTPFESLNFRKNASTGLYYGYVPMGGDNKNSPNKLKIERLGARPTDDQVEGITIVFVATNPESKQLLIVGFYKNATVYRNPITRPDPVGVVGTIIRFTSKEAHPVNPEDRCFCIPKGKGGVGQSDVWYGLVNDSENQKLFEEVITYITSDAREVSQKTQTAKEYKKRVSHETLERRSSVRHLIYQKTKNDRFVCEACECSTEKDNKIWSSSFELHHLSPFADINEDETREVNADDFAVLCSSCHRAIHRTKFVSDIPSFKKFYLGERANGKL